MHSKKGRSNLPTCTHVQHHPNPVNLCLRHILVDVCLELLEPPEQPIGIPLLCLGNAEQRENPGIMLKASKRTTPIGERMHSKLFSCIEILLTDC